MILTCILCSVVVLVFYFWNKQRSNSVHGKTLPPGPPGWPIIGNMLDMDKNYPFLSFTKWAEKYGSINQIRMGPKTAYIFNDSNTIKELFSSDAAFTGRPDVGDAFLLYEGAKKYGIIHTQGPHWEQIRRFTLRHLRDFGFGKKSMESLIMEELSEIINWLKTQEGRSIAGIKSRMSLAVINSLWKICTGKRYQHDDPELLKLTEGWTRTLEEGTETAGIIFLFPRTGKLFPGYKKLRQVMNGLREIVSNTVEEHKKTYSDDNERDFIDAFLKEIRQTTDSSSVFYGSEAEKHLIGTIGDFFVAGSDSTSSTLAWAFLFLTLFPEKQRKLQKAVEDVTGNSRMVSLSDRPQLAYAEATVLETLRIGTIFPTGAPRSCIEDRDFHGYFIPKETILMPNMYHINKEPKIWGDPEKFRPERFLSEDEKVLKKNDAFIPFSYGRRQCAGETLARDTLFLYISNIVQRFDVELDPELPKPSMSPKRGVLLNPQPYNMIVKDRLS